MQKPTKTRKALIISILVSLLLIVLVGAYALVAHAQRWWPYPSHQELNAPQNDALNAEDPTYTSEKTKTDNDTPKPSLPTTDSGKKSVSLAVNYDIVNNSIEVRTSIAGIIEDTGTCKAVFSKNGTNLVYTSSVIPNFSSSQCELIRVSLSDFQTKGAWQLQVSYASDMSEGTSSAIEVNI